MPQLRPRTAETRLVHERCERGGTRVLGPFRQAVLVLRWFLDGAQIRQLVTNNQVGKSTAYTLYYPVAECDRSPE